MTIDERLDRLTARHEALTQSVELLVHSQTRHDATLAQHEALLGRVIGLVENLARMVESHERRLSNLEGTA